MTSDLNPGRLVSASKRSLNLALAAKDTYKVIVIAKKATAIAIQVPMVKGAVSVCRPGASMVGAFSSRCIPS